MRKENFIQEYQISYLYWTASHFNLPSINPHIETTSQTVFKFNTVGHLWEWRPIAVMKAGKAVIIIGCNKGEIVSHKLSRTEHDEK